MKLRDTNDAERLAGMKESTVTEQPEVGDLVKVYLPGKSPWAECVAVHDDGSWDGRIDNYLCCTSEHGFSVHQVTRFVPCPECPRVRGPRQPAFMKVNERCKVMPLDALGRH